jgi:hypothetical protein
VLFQRIVYPSAEHAYQASKTLNVTARCFIAALPQAATAKSIGRKVNLRPDWELVKLDIMYQIVKEKFTSNDLLRQLLLDTELANLVEGNHWHDNFWGDCTCPRCANIQGQNHLGEILMRVRSELICP